MNRNLYQAIVDSGISAEVIAAVRVISASRAAVTPTILIYFTGWVEPTTPLTDVARNTAILAILSHYTLVQTTPG